MDDVGGAGNPEGAVGFEDALAGGEPGAVEFVIGAGAAGFVPFALVDADHAAGVAGDAAVGEEVGRVGEDEVDGIVGDFFENFKAVALEDAEVMFGVVEGGGGEIGERFGHDDDRSGSLIRRVRVSRREEVASGETRRKDLTQSTQRTQRAQRGERAGKRDLTQRARRRRPDRAGVNE